MAAAKQGKTKTPAYTPGPYDIDFWLDSAGWPIYQIAEVHETYKNMRANAKLWEQAPALLDSCLALIARLEDIEQDDGIDMLTAEVLHQAKIATLNAQGLTEEGYNV